MVRILENRRDGRIVWCNNRAKPYPLSYYKKSIYRIFLSRLEGGERDKEEKSSSTRNNSWRP